MSSDYSARAKQYAARALAGEQVAGKWIKAACRRFLDDLARAEAGWLYRFDEQAAYDACLFVEMLPHIEGRWAATHIVLEDWQCFILCNLFGWKRLDNSLRRFRRFYLEVARKNGKSPLAAAILLYLTFADGEPGAQVYSFATGKDQAKIVWKTAREMVKREPGFASLGAAYNTTAIFSVNSASTFKPLAKNFGSLDGLNTHGFIADELHAHKDRGLWDVMDSSTGARAQPLGGAITTAGSNTAGICYENREYVCKILNAVLHRHAGLGHKLTGDAADDEEWFGAIYTIDEEDDHFDETCWVKANPNLGVSVSWDDMRAQARKARIMVSALNEFLTKRLNVWTNADTAWMDMKAWDRCADVDLDESEFEADECIAALDLASRTDVCAKARTYRRDDVYYFFMRFYIPEQAIESGNSQYPGWVREGALNATPGDVVDLETVQAEVARDHETRRLAEVAYDPWQATQMATNLTASGVTMVETRPNTQNFSAPMKEVEALALQGKLRHTGCPVMRWMISNVVCHRDAKDNIYPNKARPENKIDGPVALFMAMNRWLTKPPESKPGFAEL